jgi:arabinofuranan 3-O-arabinosyltransferase
MVRAVELPSSRSFALAGQIRLSNRAISDAVIDQALGMADATEGGVTATSSRRLPGGLTSRASAAIDGDPTTWWSPGFLGQQREYVDYVTDRPVTVDQFEVTVVNDGRHSVPQALAVAVGDGIGDDVVQEVILPPVDDQARQDATHTFDVRLPEPVEGTHVRVTIPDRPDAVRNVETIDWFTGRNIVMPVGIAELGIGGLRAAPTPARVDTSCRTDLIEVDGEPVSVSVRGTTADLLAGQAVEVASCEPV